MAANIDSNLANWSTTDSSNQPDGTDSADIDAELRRLQAVVRKYTRNKGADIASASTTDLSTATGDYVDITGTTTITSFGTVSVGMRFILQFDNALTLTHSSALVLPGAANITTAAGDHAVIESLGSGNWVCVAYTRASSLPAKAGANSDITSLTACTSITASTVTVAASDLVYVQDASDSNNLKVVTASSVAALAGKPVSATATKTASETIGAGWNAVTGLSASITPSSTSSKVLVMVSVSGSSSGSASGIRVTRGGSVISGQQGDAAGSRIQTGAGNFYDERGDIMRTLTMTFIDSPSSASSTTYAVEAYGACYINRTVSDTDSASFVRGTSSISLLEILG